MHTIQLDISDDKLDFFLNLIKNLRDDVVKSIKVDSVYSNGSVYEIDEVYLKAKDDISKGKYSKISTLKELDEHIDSL